MKRKLYRGTVGSIFLIFAIWQTVLAEPPELPGNPGLPGLLAEISELNEIVATQQGIIDQQLARIEELEAMLNNMQHFAPVAKTGQTVVYASGDDGNLQMGIPSPDPRFIDNGDGTVTDNLTGLVWLKDANCFGPVIWTGGLIVSNGLADGQCGLSDNSIAGDWHLPNIRELQSLFDYGQQGPAIPSGHPFTNVWSAQNYWSSTTDAYDIENAWVIPSYHGSVSRYQRKCCNMFYVWPVRSGS